MLSGCDCRFDLSIRLRSPLRALLDEVGLRQIGGPVVRAALHAHKDAVVDGGVLGDVTSYAEWDFPPISRWRAGCVVETSRQDFQGQPSAAERVVHFCRSVWACK